MNELELIYQAMESCDNDVHMAIEQVASDQGVSTEYLYDLYDEAGWMTRSYPKSNTL